MEEISIREYIEILIKRKKIIAVTVAIFLIFSLVYSFFLVKPTYQTEVKFVVNERFEPAKAGYESVERIIAYLSQYPGIDIEGVEGYVSGFKSQDVMNDVIHRLKLEDTYTTSELASSIEFDLEKEPIVMNMTFKDEKDAVKITNAVAEEFLSFVSKSINVAVIEKFKKFIEYENITKNSLLNSVDAVENQIKIQSEENDEVIHFKTDDGTNIELNSARFVLQRKLSDLNIRLDETDFVIQTLQDEIDDAEKRIEKIDQHGLTDDGDTDIVVVKEAVTAKQVVKSSKKMNVILSIILGLFIGMFVAFFAEYWHRTGQKKESL